MCITGTNVIFLYTSANVCQSNLPTYAGRTKGSPPKVLSCDEILKDTEGMIIVPIVRHGWYMRKSDATCAAYGSY